MTEAEGQYVLGRIDFVDQAGTLGQLDHMENDNEYDNLVNNYSEEEWQEMNYNDLAKAKSILEENHGSVAAIRSWVEDALNRDLEGYSDRTNVDDPPGPDEPDERAILYGIGEGKGEETGISDSYDASNVLKPLAEKFAAAFLENEVFDAWITGATMPATEGRFAHLPITIVYSNDGELNVDYVEDGVPSSPLMDDPAIRSIEDSIYADEDEMEYVTGTEYRKALEMAQKGNIELEGRANPVRAISTALLGDLWTIIDSARNDISFENPPPNGIVTHVDPAFGKSVEDAFYDLDEQKLQYMKNIGKGMQLFYEDRGGRANLAVGGTLTEPVFYEFPDDMKDTLWNFEYDDLSELEG
jgi:hypothetical protein